VPCQAVDMAIAVVLPLHNYYGMGQIITDYVHGSVTNGAANGLNLLMGVGAASGMIYFNLNDVGVTEGIKQFWYI
jgi:succinate dehydrogenase (ubiquinone) membrane anchor subunit